MLRKTIHRAHLVLSGRSLKRGNSPSSTGPAQVDPDAQTNFPTVKGIHSSQHSEIVPPRPQTPVMAEVRSPSGVLPTFHLTLGSTLYHVRHRVEASLPAWFPDPSSGTIVPAVVLQYPARTALSLSFVKDSFTKFLQTDDVFQEDFTRDAFLIVQTFHDDGSLFSSSAEPPLERVLDTANDDQNARVPPDLEEYLSARSLVLSFIQQDELGVTQGPYFVVGKELHQAWRIYPDHLGAFATTVIPDDSSPSETWVLRSFQDAAFTGTAAAVAVPSRLYFKATESKPLAGRRIAIKDNMHLKGVVTGLGNKAYAELYGRQAESAKFIELLLEKGAVIVGKTKLSAFAGSEVPPCECIDYFPPWNPRGDGYQGPSGSSSGAGAAAAGYDWIDLSIGTDTTGSIRFPATSHGVWGLRATWNMLPIQGVVPACSAFDTFGLLGRTPDAIYDVLAASGVRLATTNLPTKILYPTDWLPVGNVAQQRMIEEFLDILESYLDIKHTRISIADEWGRTGSSSKTLAEIDALTSTLNGYDNYHNFDEFRAQYYEKFQKPPYVSPSHTERWNANANLSSNTREDALAEVTAFKNWASKDLFSCHDDSTSDTILLVPHGRPGANYRDGGPAAAASAASPASTPGPATSASNGNSAPATRPVPLISAMGGPQILIPIGQNPYESSISGRKEFAPIFATLVGAPGSDLALINLVKEALENSGWPTEVLTGRFMFTVGDNDRNSVSHH